MGILTADMRRVVEEQKLGFVATVCPDGTPNLSPKGTTAIWDDDHIVFADICSPGTIANLRRNPAVEINVVDVTLRKGYRFKGTGEVLEAGEDFDRVVEFFRGRGIKSAIHRVVRVKIKEANALVSPAYDNGASEAEVSARWEQHWEEMRLRRHADD